MASNHARAIRMEAALAAIGAALETTVPGAADEIRSAMESERAPDDKLSAALETIAGILQSAAPAEPEEEPAAAPAEPPARRRRSTEQEPGA